MVMLCQIYYDVTYEQNNTSVKKVWQNFTSCPIGLKNIFCLNCCCNVCLSQVKCFFFNFSFTKYSYFGIYYSDSKLIWLKSFCKWNSRLATVSWYSFLYSPHEVARYYVIPSRKVVCLSVLLDRLHLITWEQINESFLKLC